MTLSHSGPVIIVLAQPDVTYFRGLQGRYTYCLQFRVHNDNDETKFLARSTHILTENYINTRSVSVDLDLEAGSYNILIKIEPTRTPYRTAESVIESEAPYRKQKLLRIGRNFDFAHAKGKLREKEIEVRKQKKAEARREAREQQVRSRKRRHEAKARDKKRKDRIAQEKKARETSHLLRRAGYVPVPPPPPPSNPDPPIVIITPAGKITGCMNTLDDNPNAELDDDDFEWDSEMDGDVHSSSSEDEPDWYAEDPWNALLVLGLRVYSQSGDVAIETRDGNETDVEEVTPPISAAESNDLSKPKADEDANKLETGHAQTQSSESKTTTSEDVAKESSTSTEATPTPSEENKSTSDTADVSISSTSNDTAPSTTDGTITTPSEQKN